MDPWKDLASKGVPSLVSVPIIKFGKVVALFHSKEKNFWWGRGCIIGRGNQCFALENFEKNGKKAEDAIYESEKKYQTLTNPVGIYRTDVFGNTTFVFTCVKFQVDLWWMYRFRLAKCDSSWGSRVNNKEFDQALEDQAKLICLNIVFFAQTVALHRPSYTRRNVTDWWEDILVP
jgi:hypothetical protein